MVASMNNDKLSKGGPLPKDTIVMLGDGTPEIMYKDGVVIYPPTVKALGDWELDVLGVPFYGPNNGRDADGEFFDSHTKFHEDKFGLPPIVHYHGYTEDGKPEGSPIYLGKAVSREVRSDGVWYRVVLDKLSKFARDVWEGAKDGKIKVSSGSAAHLARVGRNGHIKEWPVIELSLWEMDQAAANTYGVAIPAMKKVYSQAGLELSDDLFTTPKGSAKGAAAPVSKRNNGVKVVKMTEQTVSSQELAELEALRQEKAERDKQDAVDAAVKAALKAKDDEIAEAQKKADEEAEAAKKKADEEAIAEATKANRLPDVGDKNVNVAQFPYAWKYDNLTPGAHAFMIKLLNSKEGKGSTEDSVKALAIKVVSDKDEDKHLSHVKHAMKMAKMPLKANELNQSTLANYGDEWVGVTYSGELWRSIVFDNPIVGQIPAVEVPQGSESITIPLESTPPTFYLVAQASAMGANPGETTKTVTVSKLGTANQSLTVGKIGAGTTYTGELVEDSVIPWAAELMASIAEEGRHVLEHIVIDGDTATGATTNINDIGGTPAGTEAFLLLNGFRKSPLVTTTANSRGGGAFSVEDYLETVKLMGIAGRNALDKSRVVFIQDVPTMWKSLELPEVRSRDVFVSPTIENGSLTGIWGYRVFNSVDMHRANQDATYGLKANTSGKVDLDTAANNTTGSLLAVRLDQWRIGWKRMMTIETERVPRADATEVTALMRFGMVQRDTEASAISYGLTI